MSGESCQAAAVPPLVIPDWIWERLLAEARACAPRECCGLLAGHGQQVVDLLPLCNEACQPNRYFVAEGLFAPLRRLRNTGQELVAIYHSHPASAALPSTTDLRENYYGPLPRLIISLCCEPPVIRGFCLEPASYYEIPLLRINDALAVPPATANQGR